LEAERDGVIVCDAEVSGERLRLGEALKVEEGMGELESVEETPAETDGDEDG
jgi:hypothetical protein